jgi:hypothetical protein
LITVRLLSRLQFGDSRHRVIGLKRISWVVEQTFSLQQ